MRQKWGGKDFLIGTLGRVWREGLQIGQVNKSVLHLLSVQFPLLLLRGGGLRVGRAASRRGSSSFSQSIETCVYSACCCWADEQQKKEKAWLMPSYVGKDNCVDYYSFESENIKLPLEAMSAVNCVVSNITALISSILCEAVILSMASYAQKVRNIQISFVQRNFAKLGAVVGWKNCCTWRLTSVYFWESWWEKPPNLGTSFPGRWICQLYNVHYKVS